MKILAVIQPDVRIDIKDNYNEALKYMIDHDAPFNLEYKVVDVRIKDMGTYLLTVKGYDVVFLNYSPNLEKSHRCETYPYNNDITWGVIPCGVGEDIEYLSHAISHELFHALACRLGLKFGYTAVMHQINAVMDTYYKNEEWNHPDGNFAQCWKILKPYMKLLWPNYNPVKLGATTVSPNGVEFISTFEGLRLSPYTDSAGKWTIGYGSIYDLAGNRVTAKTPPITLQNALQLLQKSILGVCTFMNKYIKVPLTQNQYDAVCSLTYNIGVGNFQKSNLLKNLNAKKPVVADNFTSWNKAGGKVIKGLVRRRADEWKLFNL